ncbi:MAG: phosphate uptake regulator PhoU [Thaumarchaeota archaeon]|nr:phosphate uptake regulator PhoU [Nitrososphaerota archaeon]
MNARKVLEMGGGTLLISLPKAWAKKNGVKKGATLSVDELSGRRLIVKPIEESGDKPREFSIEYVGDGIRQALNELTGAYLVGYDVIRVGGKVMGREERALLKETLGRLIGLEIMEEDSKHITVQFLLESSAIDPERIVRRLSGILEGMMKDTAEALMKDDRKLLSLVAERDDEVDRLYFLLVRIIRSATLHAEVAEMYRLGAVDMLDFRVLASFLEGVGDALAGLSKNLSGAKVRKAVAQNYSKVLMMLIEMDDLATRAFLTRRAGGTAESYSRLGELSANVGATLARIAELTGAEGHVHVEALGTLDRVGKTLVDISDLVSTTRLVT